MRGYARQRTGMRPVFANAHARRWSCPTVTHRRARRAEDDYPVRFSPW